MTWVPTVSAGTVNVDSTEIGAMENAADELDKLPRMLDHGEEGHIVNTVPGGETTILETDGAQWRRIFDVN